LRNDDAGQAYGAVWTLVASPEQSVPLLQDHLRPVPRPDARIVARHLSDLESADFTVRQRAAEELAKFGDAITPALRRALEGKPSLEVSRRVQELLERSRDWSPERLRAHRAIQALEYIGTRSARDVLEALAAGVPGTQLTEEAKASVHRLGH
jgi:hypothetical protein